MTSLDVNLTGFSSMFLYKRWYRCNMALESFACDTGVIDRKKNLSLEEFRSKYDGKKPVRLICLFIYLFVNITNIYTRYI